MLSRVHGSVSSWMIYLQKKRNKNKHNCRKCLPRQLTTKPNDQSQNNLIQLIRHNTRPFNH